MHKNENENTETETAYRRLQNRIVGKSDRPVQFKLPGILHTFLEGHAELSNLSLNEVACMLLSGVLIQEHRDEVNKYLIENGLSDG